jgi:PAS domain S-box-containing protein
LESRRVSISSQPAVRTDPPTSVPPPATPAEAGRPDLLTSIVLSSHDAILSCTPTGIVTSWNPAATELYGYRPDEMIGRDVGILVPPDQADAERAAMARIAAGERLEQYQADRIRRGGSLVRVMVTLSPVLDPPGAIAPRGGPAGQLIGIAAVARRLSEPERAECKFRGLLEAAPDAILGVEPSGRIALVNAQAERLFGYQRDELIGQLVDILVPHAVRDAHAGHRIRYVADPTPRPMGAGMHLSARRKDGSEFPAEISLSSLRTEDGTLVSAAIRDITDRIVARSERERLRAQAERERLEARLHQSQRLESLGQLAGGVAHDFNNLLGVILNYASFVEEEITAAAGEPGCAPRWQATRKDVEQIRRAAERATELTHQLLAFGRREVVRPQVISLNDVIVDVQDLLRRTLGEHVELETDLQPELWSVLADPGQIEQVLVNLAVNARDAMPAGGRLTIDTSSMLVDPEYARQRPGIKAGPHVRLRVSDTGTGMPHEVIERAFEPFFTTKPKGEGAGLGLATVYGIITQADGHVHIYSEPGLGTTITALLPATDEQPPEPEQRPAYCKVPGGETVLVVEDEDAMREVTRRILTRNGYQVLTAASGAEAMALAETSQADIDLLISDVIMPRMLGKEVVERLRAIRPDLRVLFMSGYAHPILASQGTLDPGVTLIEKPFSETTLLEKVREVLDADPVPG